MKISNQYVPGVCNIGPAEINKRKQMGWIGLVITVVILVLLIWLDTASIWKLILFFPAMISTVGFFQAYMHFCAHFGLSSIYNFKDVGKTDTVQQEEFRKKDRHKAWKIIIYSILSGLVVVLITYSYL